MDVIGQAFVLVFDPYVLGVMLAAGVFGITFGAIPGLTATMAVALLLPITFFMDPIPALGAIVTASAMAIFAGDIPGALLRIPGTPASAAYTDDAYNMTRQGKAEIALGVCVMMSAVGGLIGSVVLVVAAPALAAVALNFSTYEYFWLVCLGLTCAGAMTTDQPLKGAISLLIGLALTTIGLDIMAGQPRFTFGVTEMLAGIGIIPALIGVFAVSQILRDVSANRPMPPLSDAKLGNIFRGLGVVFRTYWLQFMRGNSVGIAIGALPGAGSDVGAWIAYAISKRFSREPHKFGKGHVEGIVESTAANNAGLAAEWIPALVFGVPGSTITALVIGMLIIKDMKPGPTLFLYHPELVYGLFLTFFVANIMMIGLGFVAIRYFRHILRIPHHTLMPIILLFCIVGSFAMNNSVFGVIVMLVLGIVAYVMEENEFPIAPLILAMVLGQLLEQNFLISMIKSDGNVMAFFRRPIAGALGVVTIAIWLVPLAMSALKRSQAGRRAPIALPAAPDGKGPKEEGSC
jgi:putative tricarboxylic transport membrane protein